MKKFLLKVLFLIGALFFVNNSFANHDYVCSYKVWKCEYNTNNCWWDHWDKYCQWTRRNYTTIWNTRVGCPSSSKSSTVTNFQDTASMWYFNNWWYMFWTIAWVWGYLNQDYINNNNNLHSINSSWTTIVTENTVNCIVKIWSDYIAPSIDVTVNKIDQVVYPVDNICYSSNWIQIQDNFLINKPTIFQVWDFSYNSWSNLEDCYRKFDNNKYLSKTSYTINDWLIKLGVVCYDNDTWCEPWYEINWVPYSWIYSITDAGSYAVRVYDQAGNYRTKTIFVESDNWEQLSYLNTYNKWIVVKSSQNWEEAMDGNHNLITDYIQCYLSDKVTRCDTSDLVAPSGKVSFNNIDWVITWNTWQSEQCATGAITKAICVTDTAQNWITPSWCRNWNNSVQETQLITNNILNDFWIIDNAGNLTILRYDIDFIDHSAPEFITWTISSWLAWNNWFAFATRDESPEWCSSINSISYSFNLTWPNNIVSTFDGTINNAINLRTINIFKPFNITKAWNYVINSVTLTDKAWNQSITPLNINITIYPRDIDSLILNRITDANSIYANNTDYYEYELTLLDTYKNPVYGRTDISIKQVWTTIFTEFNSSWDRAISLENPWQTDNSWKLRFKLKSVAPWIFNESFDFRIHKWWVSYINNSDYYDINKTLIDNYFKRPFVWNLSIINANRKLEIWPSLTMFLDVTNKTNLWIYNLNNFSSNIELSDKVNHEFKNWPTLDSNSNNTKYDFTIDALTNEWINIAPKIELSQNPIVSYSLWGKNIQYYMNNSDDPTDFSKLYLLWEKWISWIKILWAKQTSWKTMLTNNITNFSDLSTSEKRTEIRINAYNLIKWRVSSNTTINWVKYIEWDIMISWDQDYEVLIIKNWNVIINWNLNIKWKKLGIIVLKDWFDVNKDYMNKWNIYIDRNVTYIDAIIYADGWFISSKLANPYLIDNATRTNDLDKQLVLKWSIFTRNTVWWAVKWSSWKYILPWWILTTDFNKAMVYDLNYSRRNNALWELNKDKNSWYSENFVLIYNPILQTNPPKWFY